MYPLEEGSAHRTVHQLQESRSDFLHQNNRRPTREKEQRRMDLKEIQKRREIRRMMNKNKTVHHTDEYIMPETNMGNRLPIACWMMMMAHTKRVDMLLCQMAFVLVLASAGIVSNCCSRCCLLPTVFRFISFQSIQQNNVVWSAQRARYGCVLEFIVTWHRLPKPKSNAGRKCNGSYNLWATVCDQLRCTYYYE